MADVMTAKQRSRLMSRIRGKDTAPERYLNELFCASGFSFVRHDATLPGKPDFVFAHSKVVVFVDGDFWHGWRFPVWQHRLRPFWKTKIAKNRARDQRNFQKLRRSGWNVVRIWEHEVETDVRKCVERIAALIGIAPDNAAMDARYSALPILRRRNRLPKP